jgi:hypothetical protein
MNKSILRLLRALVKILKNTPQCRCFSDVNSTVNPQFKAYMEDIETVIAQLEAHENKSIQD